MYQWIGFAIGIVLGASVGLVIAALLPPWPRADREQEFPDPVEDIEA